MSTTPSASRGGRKTAQWAFRANPDDLEAIKRLAAQRNMSVSAYMIDAALGRLDEPGVDFDERSRMDKLEERLVLLERMAFGLDDE